MPKLKSKIYVIGTGGSISGIGPHRLDYTQYAEIGNKLTIEESLQRIPEVEEFADIQSENLISVGSTAIGPKEWLQLGHRVNEILSSGDIDGVVITHGTATLEETAYFLHLTTKSKKPVVVTGSMRPPTAVSTDADLNLLDALRVASSADAIGKGVLTVLNNEIHSAREVYKANTLRVETFRANELGFLGYSDSDGKVMFYRSPTRKHTYLSEFDIDKLTDLPRVDIVYAYSGSDSLLIDAVRQNRSDGMIMTGFGAGTFPPAMLDAGAQTVGEGIPVVVASRSTAGRTVITPRSTKLGFIIADNLHPQKARVLLTLGLTITSDRDILQQMYLEY
ncbi:MAG: asparaginase [Dehalococcoidia bacterium]|nr:asparaginase [Dehalococcoidia bacterium]